MASAFTVTVKTRVSLAEPLVMVAVNSTVASPSLESGRNTEDGPPPPSTRITVESSDAQLTSQS